MVSHWPTYAQTVIGILRISSANLEPKGQQTDTDDRKKRMIRKLAHRKDRARAHDSSRTTKVITRIKIRRKNILPEKKRDTVSDATKPIRVIAGWFVKSVIQDTIRIPNAVSEIGHQPDTSFR